MHNAELARLGVPYVYEAIDVAPENLAAQVAEMRREFAGWNLTIPHKEAMLALADEVAPDARLIGAVNTIVNRAGRLVALNTDAPGWRADIEEVRPLGGQHVAILGAGGAARAVAVACAQAGAASVTVLNRTEARAAALVGSLAPHFANVAWQTGVLPEGGRAELGEGVTVIVNTTPLGMKDDGRSPLAAEVLAPHLFVYDTVYVPAETPLLRLARERGCGVRNGLGMLARQGALAFEAWTGVRPFVAQMMQTLRRALGQS